MAYETESVIRSRRARGERFAAAAVTHESSIRVLSPVRREFACRKLLVRNRSGLIEDWRTVTPLRVSESCGIGSCLAKNSFSLLMEWRHRDQPPPLSLSLSLFLFLSSNDLASSWDPQGGKLPQRSEATLALAAEGNHLSSSRPNFQRRRSSIFSAGLFHPACVTATWRGPLTLNSHRELRRSMEMSWDDPARARDANETTLPRIHRC